VARRDDEKDQLRYELQIERERVTRLEKQLKAAQAAATCALSLAEGKVNGKRRTSDIISRKELDGDTHDETIRRTSAVCVVQ